MKLIVGLILFVTVLALIGWWRVYEYRDCRRVGHAMLYCIVNK